MYTNNLSFSVFKEIIMKGLAKKKEHLQEISSDLERLTDSFSLERTDPRTRLI